MYHVKTQRWTVAGPGDIEYLRRVSIGQVIQTIENAANDERQILSVMHVATGHIFTPLQFISIYTTGRRDI